MKTDLVVSAMLAILAEAQLLRFDVEEDQRLKAGDREALLEATAAISDRADTVLDWLASAPLEAARQ